MWGGVVVIPGSGTSSVKPIGVGGGFPKPHRQDGVLFEGGLRGSGVSKGFRSMCSGLRTLFLWNRVKISFPENSNKGPTSDQV